MFHRCLLGVVRVAACLAALAGDECSAQAFRSRFGRDLPAVSDVLKCEGGEFWSIQINPLPAAGKPRTVGAARSTASTTAGLAQFHDDGTFRLTYTRSSAFQTTRTGFLHMRMQGKWKAGSRTFTAEQKKDLGVKREFTGSANFLTLDIDRYAVSAEDNRPRRRPSNEEPDPPEFELHKLLTGKEFDSKLQDVNGKLVLVLHEDQSFLASTPPDEVKKSRSNDGQLQWLRVSDEGDEIKLPVGSLAFSNKTAKITWIEQNTSFELTKVKFQKVTAEDERQAGERGKSSGWLRSGLQKTGQKGKESEWTLLLRRDAATTPGKK